MKGAGVQHRPFTDDATTATNQDHNTRTSDLPGAHFTVKVKKSDD
jgi:hypothetical protein